MFVYLLICSDNCTYVGATVDLERRLRQHNKEIKGGAKRTTTKVNKGKTWKRACYVSGFPTWSATLQFEWRWKQLSRKIQFADTSPLERRLLALLELLSLEKSTSSAIPFLEWENKPRVHIEEGHVDKCSLYFQEDINDISLNQLSYNVTFQG